MRKEPGYKARELYSIWEVLFEKTTGPLWLDHSCGVQNRCDAPGWRKLEVHTSFKMLISFVCLVQSQCVPCSPMVVLCHVND